MIATMQARRTYEDQFYVIENATEDDILHEYHQCNICGAEPIWGIRFKCSECEDVDLCELCFDSRLKKLNIKAQQGAIGSNEIDGSALEVGKILCESHAFDCVELPLLANGLAAHN